MANCSVNVVPQRIDQLMNGLMAAFAQIDTTLDRTVNRADPQIKGLWYTLVQCWSPKACNNDYTKAMANADSEASVNEIIDRATHELSEKIDNIVHDAAKYIIPQIVTDMERARMYEDSCSQLLMCDALEKLRQLNIEGLVNEAARLKLQNVKDYAVIEQNNATTGSKMWDVGSRLYEKTDSKTKEKHHINSDAKKEVFVLTLLYVAVGWILENIYNKAAAEDRKTAIAAMKECN